MRRMIASIAVGMFLGWVLNTLVIVWGRSERASKVHVLQRPLVLYFDDGTKAELPPNTALHFDRSFPEGFSRYSIYLNIEGEPLKASKTKVREITPITAAFK